MQLQLLIPQYNETEQIIKPLLDSIAIQQGISFADISIIIGNDGSDTLLSMDFLNQYPYAIQYLAFPHTGLAGCRQALFDHSAADYIMYCDADDMFNSNTAIWRIFQELPKAPSIIVCDFLEEQPPIYIPHENDCVFVHGKVYNRNFLLKNEIVWHPDINEHQDSCYTVLALTCAGIDKVIAVHLPLYIWKWRKDSISHRNTLHSVRTWCSMLTSYDHLIEDCLLRGFGREARYYFYYTLCSTYYEQGHATWQEEEAQSYIAPTRQRLRALIQKYHIFFNYLTDNDKTNASEATYKLALKKGAIRQDLPPFDIWLNDIISPSGF